jgi:hypothetical protein
VTNDEENFSRLYPLFAPGDITGGMLFRPSWPVPPQATYVLLSQLAAFINSGGNTPLTINDTTALSPNFAGFVWVDNTSGGNISVTMPADPVSPQQITVKDATGNAGTHTITVAGHGGDLIEGAATIILSRNYGWVNLVWTGVQWVQI